MNTEQGYIRWLPKNKQGEEQYARGNRVDGAVAINRYDCFEPPLKGLSDHYAVLQTENQTKNSIQNQGPSGGEAHVKNRDRTQQEKEAQ